MTEFGKHETTEEDLASNLPPWFPKDPSSGNYNLLKPIAQTIDGVDEDRKIAEKAAHPSKAETIEEIERAADLVNLDSRRNESVEHYRTRVVSEFQLLTSEGTVKDLLISASKILDVSQENLKYTEETTTGGISQLSIPSRSLGDLPVSNSELSDILSRLVPSSYSLDVLLEGSYEYMSVLDYNNTASDPSKGFDGLDTNGNPKDVGGTYAGTLE